MYTNTYNHRMNLGSEYQMTANTLIGDISYGHVFGNTFLYNGNCMGLQTRINGLNENDIQNIREVTITCTGIQIKQLNMGCMMCTFIAGGFLIFPLCFMCCNWWKKIVFPAFDIPVTTYEAIGKLFTLPNVQTITLNLADNTFDKSKAYLLYSYASGARNLKGLTFVNTASHFDYRNEQSSTFVENMKPIKQLPIMSDLRWYTSFAI